MTDIYEAIHVDNSYKDPIFEMTSSRVQAQFAGDDLQDYSSWIENLLGVQSPIFIYAGEFDEKEGPAGQEYWLRRLTFDDAGDFWKKARKVYWVDDDSVTTDDGQIVGGYWRNSTYLTYLTVPKAGHYVPANYYLPTLQFFKDYISQQSLACHAKGSNTCNVTESMRTHMNNCSGNGDFREHRGQCECNDGWKFADCAVPSEELHGGYNKSFNSTGPKWYSFTKKRINNSKLSLSANTPFDIFISKGEDSDPNNFIYDMSMLNVHQVNLTNADILRFVINQGYSAAIYIRGIDESTNTLLNTTFSAYFEEGAVIT